MTSILVVRRDLHARCYSVVCRDLELVSRRPRCVRVATFVVARRRRPLNDTRNGELGEGAGAANGGSCWCIDRCCWRPGIGGRSRLRCPAGERRRATATGDGIAVAAVHRRRRRRRRHRRELRPPRHARRAQWVRGGDTRAWAVAWRPPAPSRRQRPCRLSAGARGLPAYPRRWRLRTDGARPPAASGGVPHGRRPPPLPAPPPPPRRDGRERRCQQTGDSAPRDDRGGGRRRAPRVGCDGGCQWGLPARPRRRRRRAW